LPTPDFKLPKVVCVIASKMRQKDIFLLNQLKMQRRRFEKSEKRKRHKDDGLVCSALAERKAKKEKETKTTVWFAPHCRKMKKRKENKVPVKCTKESKTGCKI
jgi:hypothetical protein